MHAASDSSSKEAATNASTASFHALLGELETGGFTVHGQRLDGVLNGVWTTSSELMGELGVVVLAIHKECRPLTPHQKALVKECIRQVRKAWPGFGLFRFFPPWT